MHRVPGRKGRPRFIMGTTLSTIGYEGSSLDDFLATLVAAEIGILIDVREFAGSRRKGFSKSQLRAALEGIGIEYVHLRGLGDPKEGRDAARSGDYEKFLKIFSRHMKSPEAIAALSTARTLIGEKNACLMCYEREHKQCHRKIVADTLASLDNIKIQPLGVSEGLSRRGRRHEYRRSVDARESLAVCG